MRPDRRDRLSISWEVVGRGRGWPMTVSTLRTKSAVERRGRHVLFGLRYASRLSRNCRRMWRSCQLVYYVDPDDRYRICATLR